MNSKIKNILIIGIGQMGLSHFESFYNSKNSYNIDLCDLNIEKIKKNYIDQLPSQKLRLRIEKLKEQVDGTDALPPIRPVAMKSKQPNPRHRQHLNH